ncbi:N,N-dimethylformamidase beta subunit family domain-containing protein [Saccharopolyspora sp. NPDC000995]
MDQHIAGYADQISVLPGESINVMLSCEGVEAYTAEIVRIINGDVNPDGPGFKTERISSIASISGVARNQTIHAGSFGVVAANSIVELPDSFSVQAFIWPTTPDKGDQTIIGRFHSGTRRGYRLGIDEAGALAFTVGSTDGAPIIVSTGVPLLARQWYLVGASYDAETRELSLHQLAVSPALPEQHTSSVTVTADRPAAMDTGSEVPLMFAADYAGTVRGNTVGNAHFNGKLERPRLAARALNFVEMQELAEVTPSSAARSTALAIWDFSVDIPGTTILDVSPNQLHGELIQLPVRGVTGANWSGEEMSWRHRPHEYGAIHFHDDDLYDAAWDVDFTVELPANLRSGFYAVHIWHGEVEDYVPFVVRAKKPKQGARLLFVAPTASYLAYANEHMATDGQLTQLLTDKLHLFDDNDLFLAEHREYGSSTYDTHSDGSGVCYSSRLRPILNMRPKYASWLGGNQSSLWQFNADTHIVDWLEANAIDYDVITDEDIHRDGLAALAPYPVVMTGTHPEYISTRMRQSFEEYLNASGRLIYMGGNGFYWRVAFSASLPGVMEVRKAENGVRAWAAQPGEYYTAFTGEYSGLWRNSGKTPQQLLGTGFTAQGFDVSSPYYRRPESCDPRVAFMFEGIDDEVLGDFGLIGGGAAGLELDRVDPLLGTPAHALVVASSAGHSDVYMVTNDEILVNAPTYTGTTSDLVRADMTFFETPSGGAVFSASSIAFSGSLSHADYDNNISQLVRNVVKRFLHPEPFVVP